jgi:hypothetical protein
MTDDTDPGADRRETYRLARRAYLDAQESCQKFKDVLKRALDAAGSLERNQWPAPQIQRKIAPPPMPGTEPTGQAMQDRLPTDTELDAALRQRQAARTAITEAWAAMSRTEQDECAAPPEGLNLLRKF